MTSRSRNDFDATSQRGEDAQLHRRAGTQGLATRRILGGISAMLIIGLVLVGIPALLITQFGNPLPTMDEIAAAFRLEPDWGNSALLGVVLPCATWIVWSFFAVPLLAEIVGRLTGRPQHRSRSMFRIQRHVAATLINAALFTVIAPTFSSVPSAAQARPLRIDAEMRGAATVAGSTSLKRATNSVDSGSAVPAIRERTYRVVSGDTLWAVADEFLGSGREFPEIVDASKEIEQPGGRHLRDPDLILPGWRLHIPTTHSAAQPQLSRDPALSDDPDMSGLPTRSMASDPTSTTDAPTPAVSSDHPDAATQRHTAASTTGTDVGLDTEPPPIAVTGGVAAVLAASLLAALGLRRRRQRSVRKFGERVALPGAAVGDVERQMTAVQDPATVDALKSALAHLQVWAEDTGATLPELFAVRADDEQITAYLAQPAELPAPFESAYGDNTAWTAPRTAVRPPSRPTIAPYPALVTIGTDSDGGLLLLDLEQLGALTITGPDDGLTGAALNAIAAELASVPWANDIHLSLVGLPTDLPFGLDPYRIHRVPDVATLCHDLRTHLADRQTTLHEGGLHDVRRARVVANDVEAWAPFVVLIAADCTPAEQEELMQLAHAHQLTGLVVVNTRSADTSDSTIELHSTRAASYRSAGAGLPPLPFAPQLLDDLTLAAVLEIFAIGNNPPITPPSEPETDRTHGAPASRVPLGSQEVPAERTQEAPTDHVSATELLGEKDAPYVRLLGPVDALNVTASDLLPGRGVEFLAYLLIHQQPVPGAQIQKALWPNTYDRSNNNTRTLAKQLRSALGHDNDGHLWLPEGRGNNGFTLHPAIRSDWHDFTALTRTNPSAVSTEDLETALRLVRGQPLLGTDAHRGRWAWRTALEEDILAAILDTAETVANRGLSTNDLRLTRIGARTARAADPLNELSWQIELRAAIATDNAREADRIINDLYVIVGAGDPDYEPDAATKDLIAAGRSITRPTGHL